MHFEKAFDRVLSKVMEWAIRKKDLLGEIVRAGTSLYDRTKMQVLYEELLVLVSVHQGSVLLLFICMITVVVLTKYAG